MILFLRLTVFIFVVIRFLSSLRRANFFFLTTSLHDLEKNKKITEEFTLDVTGSILVRKYHAEFVEAVDIDHYTEISLGDKRQVIVVEAKPTCNLLVWMWIKFTAAVFPLLMQVKHVKMCISTCICCGSVLTLVQLLFSFDFASYGVTWVEREGKQKLNQG